MSDRTDWLHNLSTEELLFLYKVYDVINQSTCWTIESQISSLDCPQRKRLPFFENENADGKAFTNT
jgi:hypothetical protein